MLTTYKGYFFYVFHLICHYRKSNYLIVTKDTLFFMSKFGNLIQWSTETVLGLVLLLVPLGDSVFLSRIRDIIVDAGNEQTSTCLLHRFLTPREFGKRSRNICVSFKSFMKSLCVSSIKNRGIERGRRTGI
jgi:hypothetical protein